MVIVALWHHKRFNAKHKNENQYATKFRLQMIVECGVLLNTRALVGWFWELLLIVVYVEQGAQTNNTFLKWFRPMLGSSHFFFRTLISFKSILKMKTYGYHQ